MGIINFLSKNMNHSVIIFILALTLCLNLGSSLSLRSSLENHTPDCSAVNEAAAKKAITDAEAAVKNKEYYANAYAKRFTDTRKLARDNKKKLKTAKKNLKADPENATNKVLVTQYTNILANKKKQQANTARRDLKNANKAWEAYAKKCN